MRTDYEILREIIGGFSDPDAVPTSDGLAARRPRRPLDCEVPDALAPQADGPYPYDLRQTFERRSSTTDYAPEPLDAAPLLASVQAALAEEAEAWARRPTSSAWSPSSCFCGLAAPDRASTGSGPTVRTSCAKRRARRRSRG